MNQGLIHVCAAAIYMSGVLGCHTLPESTRRSTHVPAKEPDETPREVVAEPFESQQASEDAAPSEEHCMCPNGWQEQRIMPSYSIKEHDQFLKDVKDLHEQRVIIEIRAELNAHCQLSDPPNCSVSGFGKSPLVVSPDPDQHGFSELSFEIENKHLFISPYPHDGVSPVEECRLFERYEGSRLMRLVLNLEVSFIVLGDGSKKAVVVGVIQ